MKIDSGKVSEYALATALLSRDIVPLWPSSAHLKYDIVVVPRKGVTRRIQVKGLSTTQTSSISVKIRHNQHASGGKKVSRKYTKEDVDIIVIHLIHLSVFYIIPIGCLNGQGAITIKPEDPKCRWKRYQEAWKYLGVIE